MSNLALVKKTELPAALQTLDDLQNLGQVLVKSGFFSDTKEAAQAMVKVMAGAELGFPPIASMTGIYIVKGKVSLSSNLMASAIKRSGKYDFRVLQLDAKGCRIEFFDNGASVGISEFTMAEAKAANLHQEWDRDKREWKEKPTWKNFPRNMLYARAMSNGAKWFCPEIFGGPIYTAEELGAEVDEAGQVIDLEPETASAPGPADTPAPTPEPAKVEAPPAEQPAPAPAPVQTSTPAPAPAPAAPDLIDETTARAIETLWARHGPTFKNDRTKRYPLDRYLQEKKSGENVRALDQATGKKLLGWLQEKELALEIHDAVPVDEGPAEVEFEI
jgi:hypothetical protein